MMKNKKDQVVKWYGDEDKDDLKGTHATRMSPNGVGVKGDTPSPLAGNVPDDILD